MSLITHPKSLTHTTGKLSRREIQRILAEDGGAGALLVLLRDDRVDPEAIIDEIANEQNSGWSRFKRVVFTLADTLIP